MFASQTFFLSLVCLGVFIVRECSFRLFKGFWFAFIIFCQRWDVKTPEGIYFYFFNLSSLFFFFICRMTRGYEEVSSS